MSSETPDWVKVEREMEATRLKMAQDASMELLGGKREHMPKVGICLSGGGWRAMTSGCALFDALAVPVKGPNKQSDAKQVKPLDCFSHAFGLSGGSWMLFNTLAGGDYNSFHRTADNPWLYGPNHKFDPEVNKYDGLANMVSKEVVDEACKRGSFRKNIGFLSTRIGADATIAAALGSAELGPSLVERWANFIGNDILGWIDDDEANKEKKMRGLATLTSPSNRKDYKNTRDEQSASRHVPFSSCQGHIRSGALPYVVCAAIADIPGKENPTGDEAEASEAGSPNTSQKDEVRKVVVEGPEARIYDWVEFTPFFSRNPGTGTYFANVDDLHGKFWEDDEPHPLKMHHLMAICGSAFACDLTCALPPSLTRAVKKHNLANVTSEPLIGRGTTTVVSNDGSKQIGVCRDAGIDFNIPLPPMMDEHRDFDIILVMDAGAGSKNAFELGRAAELGYVELALDGPNPFERFGLGHYVRVFRGAAGKPIIIYMLGLCERGTHQIINHRPDLMDDVDRLRDRVAKIVVPVLLAEMSIVMRQKRREAEKGSGQLLGSLVAAAQSLTANDDDDDAALVRMHTDTELEVAPAHEDFEDNANEALGPDIHDEIRAIMLNAATEGRVSNMYDAYRIAEEEVFRRVLPDEKARNMVLFKLETMALATFFPSATSSAPVALGSGAQPSVIDGHVKAELIRLDIIDEDTLNPLVLKLKDTWNAYFAATGLAASLVRTEPACIHAINRTGVLPSTSSSVIRNLPIGKETKMFTVLSDCVVAMEEKHSNRAALRASYSEELNKCIAKYIANPGTMSDKQVALNNFVEACTAAKMDNEIMTFQAGVDQRSQVMLACAAARCGNFAVLQRLPSFAVSKKNVLGAAYASTASEDIIPWLVAEHHITLSLEEAAELGLNEAASELVREPANRDNLLAATNAIEYHQEVVLAILWSHASSSFKDVILSECADHAVAWNPSTSKLTVLERQIDPTDRKARALDTFNALKDKAMTPTGMEARRNPRIQRKGVPLTEKEKEEERAKHETSDAKSTVTAAKQSASAAASKVMGFGSKLFGKKQHADPAAK